VSLRFFLILLLVLLAAPAGWAAPPLIPTPQLTAIAIKDGKADTSLMVDLSSPVPFRVAAKTNPDRVEIDFPNLGWAPDVAASGIGAGLITVYRQATLPEGGTRIVLETSAPVKISGAGTGLAAPGQPTKFELTLVSADGSPPPEITAPKATPVAQAAPPPELAELHEAFEPRPAPKEKPVRPAKHVIAIDPGHGGIDPGTASSDNVFEKNLTLQAAMALRDALDATGHYTVVMTRDEDRFVPLPDRVRLARHAKAELFISLHCDAMEGRDAHGATVYTLSETASDAVSDRLAKSENQAAAIGGVNLAKQDGGIAATLINLSMRESLNGSNRFAEMLVKQFADYHIGLQELKPHRSAGFAVLKAADMPSVLIEMGYLSDAHDAANLADPKHQREVAHAITAGVDRYFKIK
jgi:N-acetylmuramoyl-L-alanine amidase